MLPISLYYVEIISTNDIVHKVEASILFNSTGTQSHYMLKLLAVESLIRRQCYKEPWRLCKALRLCKKPYGLYGALRAVWSLTGCTEPYGLYEAIAAFSVG
jgi:hypothetical protein